MQQDAEYLLSGLQSSVGVAASKVVTSRILRETSRINCGKKDASKNEKHNGQPRAPSLQHSDSTPERLQL